MKIPLIMLAAVLGAVLAVPASASNDHAHHAAMPGHKGAVSDRMTEGLVKKVDKSAGKLTLSHGPLPNGMPAMTMVFRVKDAAWLDQLKAGDKVRFVAEQINGAMTVVQLQGS